MPPAKPASQPPQKEARMPFHAHEVEHVLKHFETSAKGLTKAEAARRLTEYGRNELPRAKGDSVWKMVWRQINNPLIWVLLASGALAMFLGKGVDGAVVFGVVILNTLIGFIQEYRAGKAIEALMDMVSENATVERDGVRITIPASELVPGDVIMLQSGDKVPADVRLITVKNLKVEEAALTGESVPVTKASVAVAPNASLGDRRCMAYNGTLVTYGTAMAVVVSTGLETELGKISSLLSTTTHIETPLTQSIEKVGKWISLAIVIVSLAIFGVSLLRGYPVIDAILAAITLAVAAIPEGLPAIITIALAIGVRRMAARKAIVRQLPAVETLGSTTVICSDKTGTLTKNEMTVQALWSASGAYQITGVGYSPEGELKQNGKPVATLNGDVRELLVAAALCNDATVGLDEKQHYAITGDPTEAALLVAAQKAGMHLDTLRKETPRVDEIPFESERQWMATLHTTKDGVVAYIKGAPEVLLSRCTKGVDGKGVDEKAVLAEVERLASHGMRVLGVAVKRFPKGTKSIDEKDVAGGCVFLGLQGMIDPSRPEAIAAVKECKEAGIVVKMITGDHQGTAEAIGRELGLLTHGQKAITGAQLAELSDFELDAAARDTNVFARVAPEQKLRLVRSLQRQGHIVAMTGDGVNDAPALKQANIGVAMGITGTAVSKEAAAIVLTNDNFASIAAAVEEGRRVFDNLIKSLAFVLPTNIGEALIILLAVLFFPVVNGQALMPIEPVQILWINLVATVTLALPLAFEAMEPDIMKRMPRDSKEPLLGSLVIRRTIIVAVLMAIGAIGLFNWAYTSALAAGVETAVALATAQTMAVTTVILMQVFYLLNCRSLHESMFRIGIFSNPTVYVGIAAILVLQVSYMYVPWFAALFTAAPLSLAQWGWSALIAASVLPVMAIDKWLSNHVTRRRAARSA
jgi:Ca2+-transporting ATPase